MDDLKPGDLFFRVETDSDSPTGKLCKFKFIEKTESGCCLIFDCENKREVFSFSQGCRFCKTEKEAWQEHCDSLLQAIDNLNAIIKEHIQTQIEIAKELTRVNAFCPVLPDATELLGSLKIQNSYMLETPER